jgi:hypothetical protein
MTEQYPSRNEAFGEGVSGGPMVASSMQQQANPTFQPDSVESMTENLPSGIGQDPRVTGRALTKDYGETNSAPAPAAGATPASPPAV